MQRAQNSLNNLGGKKKKKTTSKQGISQGHRNQSERALNGQS